GTYTLTESQPADYRDGKDTIGTPGGATAEDQFSNIVLNPGVTGSNNNFGEQPAELGNYLTRGQTATIGFWQNKNGQALIKSLNGGPRSRALGNWLAAMFPNLYGPSAGAARLAGKTNADVARRFKALFAAPGPKVDAQVLATALAVYVTNA